MLDGITKEMIPILNRLRTLPGVVVVFEAQSRRQVIELKASSCYELKGFSRGDALAFVELYQGEAVRPEDRQYIESLVAVTEGHPAVLHEACYMAGVRRRTKSWNIPLEIAKFSNLFLFFDEKEHTWVRMKGEWESLDNEVQQALAVLGQLPFRPFSKRMIKAICRAPSLFEDSLEDIYWLKKTPSGYKLPWVVWAFARDRVSRWNWWRRLGLKRRVWRGQIERLIDGKEQNRDHSD